MARISAAEKERRVDEIARMLINGTRTSECLRHASDSWGISKRMAEFYVADARAVIRADYSADRRDFLAQKLALLDEVTKKAAESNQLNAVIGATRLSAELAQLV